MVIALFDQCYRKFKVLHTQENHTGGGDGDQMDDLSLEKDRPKDKAKYLNATLEEFHNLGYYEMFVEV